MGPNYVAKDCMFELVVFPIDVELATYSIGTNSMKYYIGFNMIIYVIGVRPTILSLVTNLWA